MGNKHRQTHRGDQQGLETETRAEVEQITLDKDDQVFGRRGGSARDW